MGRNSTLKVTHMAGSHKKKQLNQGPAHSGELLLNSIPRMSHRSNLANFTWLLGDRSICFEEQGNFFKTLIVKNVQMCSEFPKQTLSLNYVFHTECCLQLKASL